MGSMERIPASFRVATSIIYYCEFGESCGNGEEARAKRARLQLLGMKQEEWRRIFVSLSRFSASLRNCTLNVPRQKRMSIRGQDYHLLFACPFKSLLNATVLLGKFVLKTNKPTISLGTFT